MTGAAVGSTGSTGLSIAAGGILAAGEGSRLRRDGWRISKPLVPIGGVPLIQHAIENLKAAGVLCIGVLFNEDEADCVRFVRARFPGIGDETDPADRPAGRGGRVEIEVRVRVKTTASSFETFRELSAELPSGRALFQTVDAWCRAGDFLRFVREAEAAPADTTVLAVTPLVDDERPLWTRCEGGASGGAIREIGGTAGDCATAGIYLFSPRARSLAVSSGADRLRFFLAELFEGGEPMLAVSIPEVVDVDRGRDVRLAEELFRKDGVARPEDANADRDPEARR